MRPPAFPKRAQPRILEAPAPLPDGALSPMVRKILLALGSVLLVVIIGGAVFVGSRQQLTFNAPYPQVASSTDSAVVERGRYIVRVAAGCSSCHGDPAQRQAYMNGAETPLIGGFVFDIPPGKFYPRNLTPDPETGLGNV